MALPSGLEYFKVTARFLAGIADSADEDDEPDIVPVTGGIVFTPEIKSTQLLGDEQINFFLDSVEAEIGEDGILRNKSGKEFVSLISPFSSGLVNKSWKWTAAFSLGMRKKVTIDFQGQPGEVVNLAASTPIIQTPTTITIKGEKGDPGNPGGKGDPGEKGDPGDDASVTPQAVEDNLPARLSDQFLKTIFSQVRGYMPPGAYAPIKVVAACDTGVINDSGAGNGTVVHDASVKRFGTASVKITCASNAGVAKATFALTPQDWSNDGITFWVRSDAWADLADLYILVGTAGVFSSFYTSQVRPRIARTTDGEWTQVSFSRGDFTATSGTPNWATVNRIMFQVYPAAGKTPSLWVDQIERCRGSKRGVVAIGFDDGFATTYSIAKPYMDNLGFRGSSNIILGRLNTNGFLTEAQVDEMAEAGWDISAHGETNLTSLSFSEAEADVKAHKTWLDDRNYKGRNVYVYPLGGQNYALRNMVRKYFQVARGTSTGGQYLSRLIPMNMTAKQAGQAVSASVTNSWIDQAAAEGSFLPLVFHNLPTTTSLPEDVTPTNFRAIMDHLSTANVDVLTISDALARGPWGPNEPLLTPVTTDSSLYTFGA